MNRSSIGALCLSVTFALLAGCGESQPPIATHVNTPADRAGSPMLAKAKGQDLIYVSDGELSVFTFPSGQFVGTIGDSDGAQGLCSNGAGAVFVANRSYAQIVEYPHASLTPSAIFNVNGEPLYCAVDPSTGNLAVTLEPSPKPRVAVFAKGQSKPKYFAYNDLTWMWYCSYDDHGDLFVDGVKNSSFGLAELPKGGKSITNVKLSGSYNAQDVGAVQWDGKHVTVGNQSNYTYTINQLIVKAGSGKVVGQVVLNDVGVMGEIWFQGSTVLGASAQNTSMWNYPAGGDPVLTLNTPESFGVTVSVAARSRTRNLRTTSP